MAGETFQLRFNSGNDDLTVIIDEAIDFASVDFQLNQKQNGYGRDVSFNGGETQFQFVKYRNHYLDKLIEYNKVYGFESIVELIITTSISTTILGELDFATAVTDDLEYFKCKVIQKSNLQVVKRRKNAKVNLFDDKDISGNGITPLTADNLILIAKPLVDNSRWDAEETDFQEVASIYGEGDLASSNSRNFFTSMYDSDIPTSYAPYSDGSADGTKMLTAANSLDNIKIRIEDFTIQGYLQDAKKLAIIRSSSSAYHEMFISYGANYGDNVTYIPNSKFSINAGKDQGVLSSIINVAAFELSITTLPQNHSIWLSHGCYVWHYGFGTATLSIKHSPMKMSITASVNSVNSVVLSFRLVDVMRQVVKSISGLDIAAPRFDLGGEFYDNRLVNGNLLRKITSVVEVKDDGINKVSKVIKKPFLISLEDLEKSLVELNIDWEIDGNGDVFFGTEDDFYTNNLVKEFTNVQFSSFNKSFNPRFQINEFNYGYKKFQSQKENELIASYDIINGESKWILQNKNVENKKDISIEWIRDIFLIEQNRRKALQLSEDTSSQDDDSIFIIDSKDTVDGTPSIPQSVIFSHFYDGGGENLILTGAAIDLTKLPMTTGDRFNITSSLNNGTYFIKSISTSNLILERITDYVTNTTATSTTYNLTTINPSTGVPSTTAYTVSVIHTFTSTDVYPLGDRVLRLTKSTAFAATHLIDSVLSITVGLNIGNYTVVGFSNTGTFYVELHRQSDTGTTPSISTTFYYAIDAIVNKFISYTNENITEVYSLQDANKFGNLRYSIKRNIFNHWIKYLSTCNLYNRTLPIKNTWYKNNKYFSAKYNDISLIEGAEIATAFIDSKPLLSPFIYNDVIFANVEFSDFIELQTNIRTTRGYIKTYDNNGLPILLHPISMKYENLSKELTIKAEERFTSTFVPTIETVAITDISSKEASSGGNILSNGYLPITAKGIVWDINPNPTDALSTKTTQGTGNSSFTSRLTLLTPNTLYYVRAYATNSSGTGYGAEFSFTSSIGDYAPSDYTSTDYSVTI
jgi:hypothetical protein